MTAHFYLLAAVLIFAAAAVMAADILMAAVSLALSSAVLAMVLFRLDAPWAGALELSVCAGLITVLFISTAGLLRKHEQFLKEPKKRFLALPLVLIAAGAALWFFGAHILAVLGPAAGNTAQNGNAAQILWQTRRADLLGQLCLFAAGVFAVRAFFTREGGK